MGLGDRIRRYLSDAEFERHEDYFRDRHIALGGSDIDYERARPAYRFGFAAAGDARYRGRDFADAEAELRAHWTPDLALQCGSWETARTSVNRGYHRAQQALADRSSRQLAVVQAPAPAADVAVPREVVREMQPAAAFDRPASTSRDDLHP